MDTFSIIGITRFSVLTDDTRHNFKQAKNSSYDQARSVIFSPERMSKRLRLFEALTLPSLAKIAQHEPSYRHIVAISEAMPLRWKLRLFWLTWRYRWCQILPIHHQLDMREEMRKAAAACAKAGKVFTFRIDDDDALAPTYVDTIRAHSHLNAGTVLSLDTGLYLKRGDRGFILTEKTKPLIAIGLGLFSHTDELQTIYDLRDHSKVDRITSVVNIGERPYWIRTVHSANDSAVNLSPSNKQMEKSKARTLLRKHFPHIDAGRALAVI